jgi:hypothetical protein
MFFALCEEVVKAGYVYPDGVIGQGHALPVGTQPTLRACLPERREGPAQGRAGATLAVFRPEQSGERVPGLALFRYSQVRDEGYRLARVDLDRHAVMLDARRAQQ